MAFNHGHGGGLGEAVLTIRADGASALSVISRVSQNINQLAVSIRNMGIAMGAFGATQIALAKRYGGESLDEAAAYQKGLIDIQKTANLTSDQIKTFEKDIRRLSDAFRENSNVISNAMALTASFGVTGKDAMIKYTEAVLRFKASSREFTVEEAAHGMAQLMAVLQESPDQIERVASVFAMLSDVTANTEKKFMHMSQNLGRVAFGYKMSTEAALAWASAIADTNERAELTRSTFLRISEKLDEFARGGAKAIKVFEDAPDEFAYPKAAKAYKAANEELYVMGEKLAEIRNLLQLVDPTMTAEKFAKAWKDDPNAAMIMFVESFKKAMEQPGFIVGEFLKEIGMGGTQANQVMRTLTGTVEKYQKRLAMAKKESELFNKGQKEQSKLYKESALSMISFGQRLIYIKELTERLRRAIGEALWDVLVKHEDKIKALVVKYEEWIKKHPKLISNITAFTVALSAALVVMGFFLMFGGQMISTITRLTNSFALLASAMNFLKHPFAFLGLIGLVVLFYWLYTLIRDNKDEIIKFLEENDAIEVITAMWKELKETWEGLKKQLIELRDAAKEFIIKVWKSEPVQKFMGMIKGWLRELKPKIIGLGKDIKEWIVEKFKSVDWDKVKKDFSDFFDAVDKEVRKAGKQLKESFFNVVEAESKNLVTSKKYWDDLVATFNSKVMEDPAIKKFFDNMEKKGWIASIIALSESFVTLGTQIAHMAIDTSLNLISGAMEGFIEKLKLKDRIYELEKSFKELEKSFQEAGFAPKNIEEADKKYSAFQETIRKLGVKIGQVAGTGVSGLMLMVTEFNYALGSLAVVANDITIAADEARKAYNISANSITANTTRAWVDAILKAEKNGELISAGILAATLPLVVIAGVMSDAIMSAQLFIDLVSDEDTWKGFGIMVDETISGVELSILDFIAWVDKNTMLLGPKVGGLFSGLGRGVVDAPKGLLELFGLIKDTFALIHTVDVDATARFSGWLKRLIPSQEERQFIIEAISLFLDNINNIILGKLAAIGNKIKEIIVDIINTIKQLPNVIKGDEAINFGKLDIGGAIGGKTSKVSPASANVGNINNDSLSKSVNDNRNMQVTVNTNNDVNELMRVMGNRFFGRSESLGGV